MALSEKATEYLKLQGFLKHEIGPGIAFLYRRDGGFPVVAVEDFRHCFLV